jgi:hypothetical protein
MGEIPTIHLSYHPEQHHFNSIRRKGDKGTKSVLENPLGHHYYYFMLGKNGKEADKFHDEVWKRELLALEV